MSPAEAVDQVTLRDEVDVLVIGAGHNGLIVAAYLAAAGIEVLVLEAATTAGGSTLTEELTLPGFAHDSCSSAHVLIQSNPLLKDDELGLVSTYGLDYAHTDPAVVLPQPGGDSLVMHRDLDATADEIARWSAPDARAFKELIREWGRLARLHGRWSSGFDVGRSEAARRYQTLRDSTAWDVVHERFTDPIIRSFMLWLAMATIQDPRRPGTGALPSSLTSGRLSFGWSTPVGGSGALPAALGRQIEAHGGQVVCSAPVAHIEVSSGRATAVRTMDGRRVCVRRGVVSSAHLRRLVEMLDGAEAPDELVRARDSWRPGLSLFAVHAALRGDLTFHTHSGPLGSVAAGLGSADGVVRQIDACHRGEVDASDPWLLAVNQTVVDKSRAPAGAGTFKILTVAPYDRADGRSWSTAKEKHADALIRLVRTRSDGLDADDILAMRVESPVDVASRNPHNLGGSCHGGEFATSDGQVIAGWRSHRTPVSGLFLTGATTHPGGSVSGRPGRNAARTVLRDLGMDPSTVMGPT